MILALAIGSLILTLLPVMMFLRNLGLFCWQQDSPDVDTEIASVSILIPARDEADSIEMSVRSALQSKGVNVEVVVLDDDSTDDTNAIVQSIAEKDERVKLISGETLPKGWNGKQFACKQLAEFANHDVLVFFDADVRLAPESISHLTQRLYSTEVGLLSAFPRQVTGSWLESWMIPMMHFILLGYLPFDRMRESNDPSFAAGCGQLFITTQDAYQRAGTHAAIANSRHDGVKLPRAYRDNGMMTDVVDGTELADCRMYDGASAVIRGLLKNATEGIANPRLIGLFTVLLLGLQSAAGARFGDRGQKSSNGRDCHFRVCHNDQPCPAIHCSEKISAINLWSHLSCARNDGICVSAVDRIVQSASGQKNRLERTSRILDCSRALTNTANCF